MRKRMMVILSVIMFGSQLGGCGSVDDPSSGGVSVDDPSSGSVSVTESGTDVVSAEPQVEEVENEYRIMIDGELYVSNGAESDIDARCGVMDGELTSEVDATELPTEDNQSNFGTGYGYQFVEDDNIDVFMEEKWIRFTRLTDDIPLVEDVSPQTSAMALFEYDGETVTSSWNYNAETEQEIIDYLNQQDVQGQVDIDLHNLTGPMYGITMGKEDGTEFKAAWRDGYWITDSGQVYQVDVDFLELKNSYVWKDEEVMSITVFPNLYYLACGSGTWDVNLLSKSKELDGQGLVLTIIEQQKDTIDVQIKNSSGNEMTYGEGFVIQVQIEGEWYDIPAKEEMSFNSIANILPAGETTMKTYDISYYGYMPSGTYQLVVEGATVEFEVKS